MKVSLLRALYTKYLHKNIPVSEWAEEMIALFESLKIDLTSQPVLARFDSTKLIILKTDWSCLGFSFILMQPANDEESRIASQKLISTGVCDFVIKLSGSGMRSCTDTEAHYHGFVVECAALRWEISKNKIYLWGCKFYCMCDMKSLYKILDYDGPIHSLRRWSQELLAYNFETIHRPATMMKDVDALDP